MIKVLDSIAEVMVVLIRKGGRFDQCVEKLIAAMSRRGTNKQQEKI
jgi:hypothetical protein